MPGMRTHRLAETGRDVPVIGQGTWNLERGSEAAAVAALRRGLELGMTHVDTAEMYGAGKVEERVGRALAGRRDEVFLVSKVLPENASRAGTIAACERSLARLATDRLDLYLLHWPGRHPLAGTVEAFERLRADGKILAWGVSNFDVPELEELVKLAPAERVVCNQVLYHLEERAIEHAVLPWCEAQGIAVVGYSPFGSGSFPGPRSRGGRVLQEIADERGATPRQIALAFLTRRPSLFAIPKAGDLRHVEENAAAGHLVLGAGEIARVEREFPLGRRPRSLPTI
jgi:diketogulonate reductase-like aldo/keto reductase